METTYQVKLDAFEGPLDLLLHLVKQLEIDIYDIPVSTITEQYMHYIHRMQTLELTVASEYLVMAATLIELKSQMLLPKQTIPENDEEYMEDPREELMQRLITYRKYKEAAEQFQEQDTHPTFTRAPVVVEKTKESMPLQVGSVTIYDMMSALDKMFERKKWDRPLDTTVTRSEIPIEQRMDEIYQLLLVEKKGLNFESLFTVHSKPHIVTTFIAILELMKNQQIICKQEQNFDALYVFLAIDETKN